MKHMKNAKTQESIITPNMLLTVDVARLYALKAAMEGIADTIRELTGMMEKDIKVTKELKRKLEGKAEPEDRDEDREEEPDGVVCIKIGPREHECHCHGRKRRGRK